VGRNERRIQILEALHQCLLEKPFHQTTIKDIAKKAKLNHGMLHYCFENKEDILLKYIEYTFNRYHEMFVERFNSEFEEDKIEVRALGDKFRWALHDVAFNKESAKIFTEIWALAIYNPKVMRKLKRHYRNWKDWLLVMLKNYVKDDKTATRLSFTIIAILEGMSLFSILFNKKDLCTDINYAAMIGSLVPGSDILPGE
jgi:AcrR family transcriptional regulator